MNESTSTNPTITEIIQDETNQVTTVVIFVILSVLVIVLIFLMAIFIDCRQQKIQDEKLKQMRKRVKRKVKRIIPSLPTIGESSQREDEQHIVENMHTEPIPSSSTAYIP
ncbi:uncharacterized protein LOC115883364 [Sitophilus oryzae]|uniref:Uncharacterized protein LOC115883364 n=1 Tax=Sitophilus oryzae TaxID=7048 RepID=A0A6J2Y3K5_SITOR|nr:uncharacterized protein LOC115883364 [Sitophilus oryzae]